MFAAIVGIWLISRFADNKSLLYGLDILAIVYFAFDIISETDYWQIKIWKSSKKGETKMRERIEKDLEKELEKRRLAKEKQSSGVHDEITVMKDNGKYAAFLPSFSDMDKDPSPEEIIRVVGLTETILHLTFRNPCPIEQDPVFQVVLNANTQSLMECLQSGKLNVGDHNELKQAFESKFSEKVAKAMIELDYWNMRMIEHAVLMKSLGPKPAYNCLSAVYSIIDIAPNECCILIVNYTHLLLKCSMLKEQNLQAIEDITEVLHKSSEFLDFAQGIKFSMSDVSAKSVLEQKLNELRRVSLKYNVEISLTSRAYDYLLEHAVSDDNYARNIDNVLFDKLKPKLIAEIVFGNLRELRERGKANAIIDIHDDDFSVLPQS